MVMNRKRLIKRLPPFSFFSRIFCTRRPGEKTDTDDYRLLAITPGTESCLITIILDD